MVVLDWYYDDWNPRFGVSCANGTGNAIGTEWRNGVSFMASYAALWFLVAFLTLVAIGLLREVTVLRRSMVGAGLRGDAPLVIGSRAPNFSAMDARSGKKTSEMLNGLVSLVAFVSPHCSICRLLMDNFKSVLGRGAFALEEFVANALREIDPRGSAFQSATK